MENENTRPKPHKQVRTPRQQRSIEKTDMIKKAALDLFSEKGYYNTTTNEIAKKAGINIGTLYSYFENKLDIYEELVKDHYLGTAGKVDEKKILERISQNLPAYDTMYMLVSATFEAHLLNTAFQKEMAALSAQSDEMRAIEQKYRGNIGIWTTKFLEAHKEYYRVTDHRTAGLLIATSMEAVIHEISFYPNSYDKERVLKELTDMFCTYLIKPEYLN